MKIKLLVITILFLLTTQVFSQNKLSNFGKVTDAEKNLTFYMKDSSANALVLYERGDNYFKVFDNRILLVKEYHTKIKILNEKGFDEGTISIPLYHNKTSAEKIIKIKAMTHNENTKVSVLPEQFFTNDLSEKWREKTFTFPQLQKGSILEYTYTLTSPYIYNFNGWDFQSSIPKLYSEFNAKIPGNYQYNRNLQGSLLLSVNDAKIKKECFQIDGIVKKADCEVLKYAIKDIPAFKEEEGFMLAASNYKSRIDFELSELRRFDGGVEKYTKTWKDVDREFRSDKNIGRQLTKKGFFEKNVPENLLVEGDDLTRAKNIYNFVRSHFTWNEKFGIFRKARVKEAFETKTGSVGEINMSLINLLNTAGIKTNLVLMSTRQQGLPKKTHPVISDFNYFIAKTTINGEDYLLDATDKFTPFGYLPFRALNHYGRVMDFKNESYWYTITPSHMNLYQIRAHVDFSVEEDMAKGIMDIINTGYNAFDLREIQDEVGEEEYLELIENSVNRDFQITSYEIVQKRSDESKVTERLKFEIGNIGTENTVYLNPFFIRFFQKNPFTLDERHYPIDFGYPRKYKYQIILKIPEGYSVKEFPEARIVNLGDKMASMKFFSKQVQNQLSIAFEFDLNTTHFSEDIYDSIKQMFKDVVAVQNNSLIVLKKS